MRDERSDRESPRLRGRLDAVERDRNDVREKLRQSEREQEKLKRALGELQQDRHKIRVRVNAIKRDIDNVLSDLTRRGRRRGW